MPVWLSQPPRSTSMKGHASFNQSSCHQATSTKGVISITLADRLGFLFDAEGFHLLASHQVKCLLEDLAVIFAHWATILRNETLLDHVESGHALYQSIVLEFHVEIANASIATYTENGAHDIPRKPGPSLAPPTEMKGGMSRSVRCVISSCAITDP